MSFLEGLSTSLTGSKNAFKGHSGNTQSDPTNSANTFIPNASSNQSIADLVNGIYSTETARQYGNSIDQGYQNLGQPLHDNSNRDDVYVGATRGLASSFADRFYQKTGQLPTEDQVRQFVGSTLTPGFAQKFITGIAPDQLHAMSDSYIQSNPDLLKSTQDDPQSRILALNDQLDKIYNTGKQNYVKSYDENVYAPAKESAVNDLAGQNLLTQPNSRFALDKVESNRGRDISSGLNTLESNRATGAVDLGKTIENLLQGQQQISNQNSQFNKSLNLTQDQIDTQNALNNRQLSLADRLGQLNANANKPGWMDYLNTGLKTAGTVAQVATAFA